MSRQKDLGLLNQQTANNVATASSSNNATSTSNTAAQLATSVKDLAKKQKKTDKKLDKLTDALNNLVQNQQSQPQAQQTTQPQTTQQQNQQQTTQQQTTQPQQSNLPRFFYTKVKGAWRFAFTESDLLAFAEDQEPGVTHLVLYGPCEVDVFGRPIEPLNSKSQVKAGIIF